MGMIIVAPILVMLVFGLAFGGDVENLNVIIVDMDESVTMGNMTVDISDDIVAGFDGEILVMDTMEDLDDAIERVEDGKSWGVIYFPPNMTRDMLVVMNAPPGGSGSSGDDTDATTYGSNITLHLDESNVNIANTIRMEVATTVQEVIKERSGVVALGLDDENAVYAGDAKFIDMFVPGIMAFAIWLLTSLLTLLTFVGERTSGTLHRLMTTPIREEEIVLGYALTFGIIGMIQCAILMTVGILIFDIIIVGNPLLAFFVASLLAITAVSLGILLSAAARNELQAVQFIPMIVLPVFLLAGIFWPVEAIPPWLRPAAYAIPVTYAVEGLRSVMLRGWGFMEIIENILAVSGFMALFLGAAVLNLKKVRQ